MYTVAVQREFVAQHYLVGGDWGRENQWHSHHYRLEVRLAGPQLDRHGFLVDIVEIDRAMDLLEERFRDKTLNDDPAFAGLNPSVEQFARIASELFAERIDTGPLDSLAVTVWEDGRAYAACEREV